MPSFLHSIGVLAAHNPFLAYLGLFGGIVLLGNVGIFAGLWFVTQGYFGSWGVLIFIVLALSAEIGGDLLWYFLGRSLRDTRIGMFFKNRIPYHRKAEMHIQKNSRRWIFLSKFLYAATFPIIFMVGWCKVGFMKFFKMSLVAIFSAVPLALLVSAILISSASYLQAITAFRRLEWVFLAVLFAFIAIQLGVAKWIKFTFGRNEEE